MNDKKAVLLFVMSIFLFPSYSASSGTVGTGIKAEAYSATVIVATAMIATMISDTPDARSYLETPLPHEPEKIEFYETDGNGNLYRKSYRWERGKLTETRQQVASRKQPVFSELYNQLLILLGKPGETLIVTESTDKPNKSAPKTPRAIINSNGEVKQSSAKYQTSQTSQASVLVSAGGYPIATSKKSDKHAKNNHCENSHNRCLQNLWRGLSQLVPATYGYGIYQCPSFSA